MEQEQQERIDLSALEEALLTDSGSESDLEHLKANGPRSLPPNPTANNWSYNAIIKQLASPSEINFAWLKNLTDAIYNVLVEIKELAEESSVYSAERDAEGNVIHSTYATDSSAVHKAGVETITDSKSFGSSGSDNSKTLDVYFTTNLRGPVTSAPIMPGNSGFSIGNGTDKRWNTGYFQYVDIGTSIKSGSNSWTLPSNSGVLAMTSDVGTAKSEAINHADDEVGKILGGTYLAYKAKRDADGNDIKATYETKTDATAKVALSNLRSILGLASSSAQGLMSSDDKNHLDALYALLGDESDSDAVVNTIKEVLAIFAQYPEGVTLANALASKVSFADVINNLESVDIARPLSAYMGKVLDGRLADVEEDYVTHDDMFSAAMFEVTDYDESTGEVTLSYSSAAISDITYNSSTGEIVFTY